MEDFRLASSTEPAQRPSWSRVRKGLFALGAASAVVGTGLFVVAGGSFACLLVSTGCATMAIGYGAAFPEKPAPVSSERDPRSAP